MRTPQVAALPGMTTLGFRHPQENDHENIVARHAAADIREKAAAISDAVAEKILRKIAREYKRFAYSEEYDGKLPTAKQLREDHGDRFRVRNGYLELSTTYFYSNTSDCGWLRASVIAFAKIHGHTLIAESPTVSREWNNWPKESWATHRLSI